MLILLNIWNEQENYSIKMKLSWFSSLGVMQNVVETVYPFLAIIVCFMIFMKGTEDVTVYQLMGLCIAVDALLLT